MRSIASVRIGLRQAGRARDDSPSARNAPRGDELGDGANTAALSEVAVPPIRGADEQEGRDSARSAAIARGGKEAARDAGDPEQRRELADVPDRHSWRDRQGQGEEPAYSIQPRGPARRPPRAAGGTSGAPASGLGGSAGCADQQR